MTYLPEGRQGMALSEPLYIEDGIKPKLSVYKRKLVYPLFDFDHNECPLHEEQDVTRANQYEKSY